MNDQTNTLDAAQAAALQKGLQALALIKQGQGQGQSDDLARRSYAFIVGGDDAAVLQALNLAGSRASSMLGQPGRLSHGFFTYGLSDKEEKQACAGLAARAAFYAALDSDALAPALLVRLAKVLQAGDNGQSLQVTGAAVPDWLHYLVNDALYATCTETYESARAENRPAWNVWLLARLLEADGLPGAEASAGALSLVFERRHIAEYLLPQCLQRLLAPRALHNYLLEHAEQVRQLAPSLSAQGKRLLAATLGETEALAQAFPDVLVRLAIDAGKTVRAVAAPFVGAIGETEQLALLRRWLFDGTVGERTQAAELLGRAASPARRALLEQALAAESAKAVKQVIKNALTRTGDDASDEGAAPVLPPMLAAPVTLLDDEALVIALENHVELIKKYGADASKEIRQNLRRRERYDYEQRREQRQLAITEDDIRGALGALNGESEAKSDDRGRRLLADDTLRATLALHGRLFELDQFGVRQLARWYGPLREHFFLLWEDEPFQSWFERQDPAHIDLRTLDALLREAGAMPDLVALACLQPSREAGAPQQTLPPDAIWPLFFEQPALIDQGLGLAVTRSDLQLELAWTLDVLESFPVVPARWRPRLMALALGEGKTYRHSAQQILSKVPGIGVQVIDSLASSKQELRAIAARWLADLDYRAAVPALYQALQRESRETVSAALMAALEQLGADLAPRLGPAALLADARKGLKAKAPAGLAWFPFETLPACEWADGALVDAEVDPAVDPDIVRWWVVLACKLKEPAGSGLLARYLGLLAPASRAALGSVILRLFIAYDERQGSVIGEKGILALAGATPGHEAVTLLQAYLRDFYPRRAQIEALLASVAVGDDPAVIQLLLGVARRFRSASVQQAASALVEQVAERKGWSEEQLADRTVPTGGLDDTGRLDLVYGTRRFYVTFDAALKPLLHNADGKPVKALPEPRHDDDADSIKEAKQALAACKKELKQVIDMQTARLYDAMCSSRAWPAQEWQSYLQNHAIVGRLVQRLVWMVMAADGTLLAIMRPAEDGSLLDAGDNEMTLAPDSQLRLAHAALLDPAQLDAWRRHLDDYRIKPLFGQLQRIGPDPAWLAGMQISDRLGWISDAYTLRGAFGKLGYQRAAAEDGGVFDHYFKDFGAAGWRVEIEFSGNALPEENLPATLKSLRFERLTGPRNQRRTALSTLPPVLLAEAYGDYLAVAAACDGYDADWHSKMPW